MTGLTDIRDQREAQTIALVMDHVSRRSIEQAMDVLTQRLLALQLAKGRKGGSWEKAEGVELLPGTGSALVPGGMLALGT